ncbi:MAG: hypothetical protein RI580_00405 [Halothece sp. Uz-M2-17]|nr:hypothetical protein [Halothece sp. Uz-M2-17]
MRLLKCLTAFSLAGVALNAALPTNAATFTYELNNIQFGDGTSVTGSFIYDDVAIDYSSINISTATGSGLTGATYTDSEIQGQQSDSLSLLDSTTNNQLTLSFDSDLIVGVNSLNTFEFNNSSGFVSRNTSSGTVEPVPFEAEGAMGLVALAGYFGYRRLRKQKQTVA